MNPLCLHVYFRQATMEWAKFCKAQKPSDVTGSTIPNLALATQVLRFFLQPDFISLAEPPADAFWKDLEGGMFSQFTGETCVSMNAIRGWAYSLVPGLPVWDKLHWLNCIDCDSVSSSVKSMTTLLSHPVPQKAATRITEDSILGSDVTTLRHRTASPHKSSFLRPHIQHWGRRTRNSGIKNRWHNESSPYFSLNSAVRYGLHGGISRDGGAELLWLWSHILWGRTVSPNIS